MGGSSYNRVVPQWADEEIVPVPHGLTTVTANVATGGPAPGFVMHFIGLPMCFVKHFIVLRKLIE